MRKLNAEGGGEPSRPRRPSALWAPASNGDGEAPASGDHEQLFDLMPIAACVIDASSRVLRANVEFAQEIGSTRQGCIGCYLPTWFADAQRPTLERRLRNAAASAPQGRHEIGVFELADRSVERRMVAVALDSSGEGPRWLVTLMASGDRPSEGFRRNDALVEDVHYHLDEDARILDVDAAFAGVWGRDVEHARGQDWFDAVHPEDRARTREAFLLMLRGDPFDEEYRIVRADGETRWIRDRALSLDGPGPRVAGAARDITDDRELEEEIRQAQKLEALGTMASSVAHDFGNLLQGVMGCLNLALSDRSSPVRARDYVQQALSAVRSGADLVSELMRFGSQKRARPKAIVLDAVLANSAELLRRLLGEHIVLSIEAAAASARVRADPVQIEQILMNLAANARDAMPRGGRLSIRTAIVGAREDGALPQLRLEVQDVGSGMDAETRARAFDLHFTTKPPGKGGGRGLTTVRALARSLGGRVDIESEPGKGTSVIFHFPSVVARDAAPARPQPEPSFSGRALLIEDDWRVRVGVRYYLQQLGFEVLEAGDATEALSLADASVGLLVSDVILPEVTGPGIRELLREAHPELKALYISAHPARYLIDQGLLEATDTILQKPFDLQEFAHRLAEVCTPSRAVARTPYSASPMGQG